MSAATNDVLLVGNVGLFAPDVVEALAQEHRLVAAHTADQAELPCVRDSRVRAYAVADQVEDLVRLFDIYSFETVVFASGFADGGQGLPDEQDLLTALAQAVCQAGVGKFVYLAGQVPPRQGGQDVRGACPADDQVFPGLSAPALLRASQQEELCRCMLAASRAQVKLVVVRLPFLADASSPAGFLRGLVDRVDAGEDVRLPFAAAAPADLLSTRDLGSLLCHIAEEPDDESGSFEASSGYARTWGDLAVLLSDACGRSGACTCADELHAVPAPVGPAYPVQLRRAYGWIPFDDAFSHVDGLCADVRAARAPEGRPSLLQRAREAAARAGFLKYVELIVLFVLVQLVNDALGSNIYYRFVDVRLLFVVLMGTMHGMRMGVLAALLACASMLMSYIGQGTTALSLVMRVENWLPFALYLLVGAICGYVTDKKGADLAFARDEYGLLYDKYCFLNEVYTNALENKRLYKRQIIGFEDSFGRIFSVVQKLDDVMPQKLYLKALEVLEDVLRNRTVALYAVDDYVRFGRLMACSRSLCAQLPKSADLSGWSELVGEVQAGRVWRNVGLQQGAPALACGSFRDGRLQMVVCVWSAEADQLDMRFANLLKVMCGLLDVSFGRAQDYAALARDELCFPGTDVMRPEPFADVLAAQREMNLKGVADYALLRFDGLSPEEAQDRLVPVLRVTDEVGVGPDGCVMALLRQARADALEPVRARLEAAGLPFEPQEG